MITTNIPEGTEVLIKAKIKGPSIFMGGRLVAEIGRNNPLVTVYPDEIAGIAQHVEAEAPVDPAKENHNLIELCIEQGTEIGFMYQKEGALESPEQRYVLPECLFTSRLGHQVVGGEDSVSGYRTFRLDRIKGAVEPLH